METWDNGPMPPRVAEAATTRRLGGLVTARAAVPLTWLRIVGGSLALLGTMMMLVQVLSVLISGGDLVLPTALALVLGGLFAASRRMGPRRTLYLFERGAIVDHPRRSTLAAFESTLAAFDWTELAPYEAYRMVPGGARRWVLTIKVAGRTVFTCEGDAAARLAEVMSAIELARARVLLAAGSPVDYGTVKITREVLVFGRWTTPWAEVDDVRAGRWAIHMQRGFRQVLLRRDRTPHQRTLLALGEQLTAEARSTGRPA